MFKIETARYQDRMPNNHVALRSHSGLRPTTPTSQRATDLAAAFSGLPAGATRWRLAAALRGAAKPLGLSSAMLRLLELYIDLSHDIDWTAGNEPIICRPLLEIAERLGRSERQIRNLERALMEKGLLIWHDSANHHRKGRRDYRTGRLLYAYGPSLAPLGHQYNRIMALAEKTRRDIAALQRCRIAIAALRRRIRSELAMFAEDEVADITAAFTERPARHRAGTPLDILENEREILKELAETLTERTRVKAKITGEPEIFEPTESNTQRINAINGYCTAMVQNDPMTERRPVQNYESPRWSEHPPIGLRTVLNAISTEFRNHLEIEGNTNWHSVIQTASDYRMMLGIEKNLWNTACITMGREQAALSIIIIDQGMRNERPGQASPIRAPNGYLAGMIKRAKEGRLNIAASLIALAKHRKTTEPQVDLTAKTIVDHYDQDYTEPSFRWNRKADEPYYDRTITA